MINSVLSAFPFQEYENPGLEDLVIQVLEENEPFKKYVQSREKALNVIDEEPRPGGVYLHHQNTILLRRPLDEHVIAHEYAHAIDRALSYASERPEFKNLYLAGGTAISHDAYFAPTEWFAENLAAQAGWTQDGRTGDAARSRLREVEPAAAAAFERLMREHERERVGRGR